MEWEVQVYPKLVIAIVQHDFFREILKVVEKESKDNHNSHEVWNAR